MAACPSRIRISLFFSKVMDLPVGNSPGPETIFNCTDGELLNRRPSESSTLTVSCTSSVPSACTPVVSDASSFNCAGVPS